MTQETTIGMMCLTYECTILASIKDVRVELERKDCAYTAKQYCDWRYSTNLQRFAYDPFTGEKIDWKEVRRMLE